MQTKFKNKLILLVIVTACAVEGFGLFFDYSSAQLAPAALITPRKLDVSAYIVNNENKEITNGEYEARFAFYATDRTEKDEYPSETDLRLWEEVQKVKIENGILKAYLGTVVPLPESLNFGSGEYYLGIRIGTDSEMTPRKKVGAVPLALNALNAVSAQNAESVGGAKVGTGAGNLLRLGSGGKVDIKNLPTGTSGKKLLLAEDLPSTDITVSGSYDYIEADGLELALGQIDLGTDVTGTLSIGQGGTGLTSISDGSILYADGNDSLTVLTGAAADDGELLTFNWNGGNPTLSWAAAAGGFTSFTVSGDNIGADQTISDGNTLEIVGGTNIGTVTSNFDTLTINLDSTLTGAIAWQGSVIDEIYGGTGQSAYVTGDMLYASAANTLSRLGISAEGRYLRIAGGIPTWVDSPGATSHNLISTAHSDTNPALDVPVNGDLLYRTGGQWRRFAIGDPDDMLRVNAGGNGIEWDPTTDITTLGTITTGTWNADAIGVTRGGTGLATIDQGGILYADANDSLAALEGVAGDDGEYLQFHWNAGAPTLSWNVAAGSFTSFTVVGDAGGGRTISNTNTLSILGGTNIGTVDSDVDTLTINLDSTLTGVTWNGTAISTTYGGTGLNTSAVTDGQLLIGNDAGNGFTLAALTQGAGMTITNGAGSISIASTLGTSVDLTTEITGTLPIGNGGTGTTTLTDGGVLL
ncbi:MAG: hypothetical protein QG620_916, partial [Patescibacteria group bacterium]|nr:hypothetical protein [Patescibacteria group bacterium]